ncbi:hypothetical protein GNE00_14295 [Pseudomonas sp. JL972]|uniref:hypothetical protein n=1 Tax=Stutzerimonas degradans TaxID=2968968 RepID=UPI0012D9EF11|nr:hypothetical protein [Stutzerimonas degradans]MTZ14918.1 hypothetical protein [Stutzerimonas degradans]
MDKILLTVFLSALAGFITAALSIVKLVNEKESKTSDYRQAWTETVRAAFSELIASINSIAGLFTSDIKISNQLNRMYQDSRQLPNPQIESEKDKRLLDHLEKTLSENRKELHIIRRNLYESYALVRLHFKPNDLSFNRVEQKFDSIQGLIRQLEVEKDEGKSSELREKIHSESSELAGFARDILKTEWETVKKGEPAYKRTKKWSVGISIAMLFVLFSIGIHAAIAAFKA